MACQARFHNAGKGGAYRPIRVSRVEAPQGERDTVQPLSVTA